MSTPVEHLTWSPTPPAPAPVPDTRLINRLQARFFPTMSQGVATLALALLLIWLLPPLLNWAVVQAVWSNADPARCAADGAGACWAVIAEKYRVMLFGAFPYAEHWRAGLAAVLIVLAAGVSAMPRFWTLRLAAVWAVVGTLVLWLMLGGLGLKSLSTSDWGGLPLTLMLFAGTFTLGLPLSLMLALGRQSHMPAFRVVCIGVIEVFRGLPLLVVLFMASLMLPLFLGDTISIDKFLRAQIGMVIFFAAYAAEIIRGGLQAIPAGQYEGAKALGLGYWGMMIKVILPQALRIVVPALVNDIIRAFKNTSFVAVIGMFDFLGATRASLEDPVWVKYSVESYLFIIFVYFCFCMTMSRYSIWVEHRINTDRTAS